MWTFLMFWYKTLKAQCCIKNFNDMKKYQILSVLLIITIPNFANGILETFEVSNQDIFNGNAILNWIGDVGDFEITSSTWTHDPAPDFTGSHSLRASSDTEINATILTNISSFYNHEIKTRWEVFVSGGSTDITGSKGFSLILFVNSDNIDDVETGCVNGYRLSLSDPNDRSFPPDGLYFEKANGSGWVIIDSVYTGDAKINQGWTLAVERDSDGNWSWGYSNGAYNSSVSLAENIFDNDYSTGSYSGMNWYSIASDANSFGFDNFKVDPYTPGMWREDAAGNDWNTASNWEDGLVPGASTNVQIVPGTHQPEIGANASCHHLNIFAGANLIINSGQSLTINGDLLIESNADGDGHLIDHGNLVVNGSSGIQRYLKQYGSGNNEFHFLSIPVANHAVENSLNHFYVYPYNESVNSWTSLSEGDLLIKGKAYSVYYSGDEDQTVVFSGEPNTGDQSINVSATNYSGIPANDNWNLVGNPFPSAIDWDVVNKTNIESAIYIWNPSSLSYASYVDGVGTNMNDDGIIPSMQGFFVHATSNGSFVIPQSSRTRSHDQDYLKNQNKDARKLKIIASRNGFVDEMVIRSLDDASLNFDPRYDAYKFLSDHAGRVQIYSLDNALNKLSVNSIPPISSSIEIPIGISLGSSDSIMISISGTESFGNDVNILLEDQHLDQYIEITKDTSLSLYLSVTEQNRFKLHLIPQLNSIRNEIPLVNKIWVSNNFINIELENISGPDINMRLFDLSGRILSEDFVSGRTYFRIPKPLKSGVYILQIQTLNNQFNTKIYVGQN